MKKFIFLSIICLLFTFFTNNVIAQINCDPNQQRPGDLGCCFWLEQIDEDQILSPIDDDPQFPSAAKYNLNPMVPGKNFGKTEFYYFRFKNCYADPKTQLSINWQFYVDGQPYDLPLDAIAANPKNLINAELAWKLPLINHDTLQTTGPLLSGMGLCANDLYTTINSVKRAVRTDFPGTIDADQSNGNGGLFGYFNPYNVQHRWYNYIYADFLEWLCENNYLCLKITRYSSAEVKIHFEVIERYDGTDFEENYIPTQQNDWMGGHGAKYKETMGDYWLEPLKYTQKELVVCAGETVTIDNDGTPLVISPKSPAIPEPPITDTVNVLVLYKEWKAECKRKAVDSVITYYITWMPYPNEPLPAQDTVAICGPGKATLAVSDPNEDLYDFTFKWYADKHLKHLVHTGKTFTDYYHHDNKIHDFYVTATVGGCESEPTPVWVWVMKTLKLEASITEPILCYDGTGTVTLTAKGGVGAYDYFMKDEDNEWIDFANPFSAGTYHFKVEDTKGCSAKTQITLTEPPLLTISASINSDDDEIQCNGETGKVTVQFNGGIAPKTVSYAVYVEDQDYEDYADADWHLVHHNPHHFNALAGHYLVRVVDANGCYATDEVILTEPKALGFRAFVDEDDFIKCFGEEGLITLKAWHGTAPYTYFIEEDVEGVVEWVELDNSTVSLPTGTYNFKVVDANGCEKFAEIFIDQPERLTATYTKGTILCHGESTTVTITNISGGTPPYTYNGNSYSPTTGNSVTVPVGPFTITILDDHNCSYIIRDTISQPDLLEIEAFVDEGDEIQCNDGQGKVTVEIQGGVLDYTVSYAVYEEDNEYEDYDAEDWTVVADVEDFTLPAGHYLVRVVDGNGCYALDTLTLEEPDHFDATPEITSEIMCFGDEAEVTFTLTGGTTPYFYFDEDEDDYVEMEGDELIVNLPANTQPYQIGFKDANGCLATGAITITQPTELWAEFDLEESVTEICYETTNGILTVVAHDGTPFIDDEEEDNYYEYLWSNGATTATVTGLTAGEYYVIVTDANGCTDSIAYEIINSPIAEVSIVATKDDCTIDEIRVIVTSTYPVTVTIQGYNADNGDEIEDLYTEITDPAVNIPYDFTYTGTVAKINFKATAVDANGCSYTTDFSNTINHGNLPMIYAYPISEKEPLHDKLDNYMYVPNLNEEFIHYFYIEDVCNTDLPTRLSVDYVYYYQADSASPKVKPLPFNNYLYADPQIGGYQYYTTPVEDCSASGGVTKIYYNHIGNETYYPYQANNNTAGFYYGVNPYSYFRLTFIRQREIEVKISGFTTPGIYTIDYELVTHYASNGGLFGQEWSGIQCGMNNIIGGRNFYASGYTNVPLARRTMIIEVGDGIAKSIPTSVGTAPSVTLYPNPAKDNVQLKFDNVEGAAQVRVVSTNGVSLLNQNVNVQKGEDIDIKLPELPAGIYIMYITTDKDVLTSKLVINR